jgi:transcriptional repressor NrdR
MQCPKCRHIETRVIDSRSSSNSIKRRRICAVCSYRFTTIEEVLVTDLFVEKRNGTKESFDQNKLEMGIRKAFNKRAIDEFKIREIMQRIVEDILKPDQNLIKSTKIGKIVLKNLKNVDEAAYICYWAMFGNFETLNDFNNLIKDFE